MKIEVYFNIIIFILTILGFIIGFINPEYRILAWSLSLVIATIMIIFLIFKDYIRRIENIELDINEIKKDLNIEKRLSILEGKINIIEKRKW